IPAPGTGTRTRPTSRTATGSAMASSAASDALSPGGRRVIVTGAEGGIGRATVATLERAGCAVAGCDAGDFDVRDRAGVETGVGALAHRPGGSRTGGARH